jgi:hypothetical protein
VFCRTAFAALLLSQYGWQPVGAQPGPTYTVRDSAGIQIVESSRPAWQSSSRWQLAPEPSLRIGSANGEPQYLLHSVRGASRLDDGRIVIANGGDKSLRFFAADGRFITSVGRGGRGPDEFVWMMGLIRAGDSLYVDDPQQGITAVFNLAGARVGSIKMNHPAPFQFRLTGVQRDGSLLQVVHAQMPGAQPAAASRLATNTRLLRSRPASSAPDTILSLPGAVYARIGGMTDIIPFSMGAAVAATPDAVFYGWPESYDIRVHDNNGNLLRRIRRAWVGPQITNADREFWRKMLTNPGNTEPLRAGVAEGMKQFADNVTFPRTHAAFGNLYADRAGNLWVRRMPLDRIAGAPFRPWERPDDPMPNEWDVFDARGVWLGSMALPPLFTVQEIGDNYMLGVLRDKFDVEQVVVYELIKSRAR